MDNLVNEIMFHRPPEFLGAQSSHKLEKYIEAQLNNIVDEKLFELATNIILEIAN